jgi:hypothetical protein
MLYIDPTGQRGGIFLLRSIFICNKFHEKNSTAKKCGGNTDGACIERTRAGFSRSANQTGCGHQCAPLFAVHGMRMKNPEGAFDLMTFPADQDGRFRNQSAKERTACRRGKACSNRKKSKRCGRTWSQAKRNNSARRSPKTIAL